MYGAVCCILSCRVVVMSAVTAAILHHATRRNSTRRATSSMNSVASLVAGTTRWNGGEASRDRLVAGDYRDPAATPTSTDGGRAATPATTTTAVARARSTSGPATITRSG